MRRIYQGQVGVQLQVGIPPASELDITDSTLHVEMRTPSGGLLIVVAVLDQADSEQRSVSYVTKPAELVDAGSYSMHVTFKYRDRREEVLDPLVFQVWPRGRAGASTTVSI